MKRLLIVGVALLLAGCANDPGAWQTFGGDVPCKAGRDCQIKMSRAYDYLEKHSEAPIAVSTSNSIKTGKCKFSDACIHYEIHKGAVNEKSDLIHVTASCEFSTCLHPPKESCDKLIDYMYQ